MPINNNLFGVFKSFKLGGIKVVATNMSRNRNMAASPVNYVQGTPKARVLDIGQVSETLTINAPLFIGTGSTVDGRYIANKKIEEILSPTTATLPLLTSATFTIGAEQSSVSLNLESDGDPNNLTAFEILNSEVEELNPALGPTRLAKFYDFRVQIGSRKYFMRNATLNVTAQTDKVYFFIPGDWNDFRGWGTTTTALDLNDPATYEATGIGSTQLRIAGTAVTYQPGTQFPFMGISTIQITGSGQAAVLMQDLDADDAFISANESINLSLQPGTSDLDLQDPGYVRYVDAGFKIEIYDPAWKDDINNTSGFGWTSFLTPSLSLSEAVVNTSNFSLTSGLLTVDFGFVCWVR